VHFVLDADAATLPDDHTHNPLGIRVEFSGADGLAVATTTGQRLPGLFRDPVAWTDDLLVPVGRHESEGWLHLPLLSTPIAVTGPEGPGLVSAMLLAAAIRAGAGELHIFVAEGLTLDAQAPEGMELPAIEPIATAGLPALLAEEAHSRARVLADKSCDNFAELCVEWPGLHPAWVLVLDAATALRLLGSSQRWPVSGSAPWSSARFPGQERCASQAAGSRSTPRTSAPSTTWSPPSTTWSPTPPPPSWPSWRPRRARNPSQPDETEPPPVPAPDAEATVRIHVLGGYRVQRRGADVALTDTTSA
jgi:hypothetical protein